MIAALLVVSVSSCDDLFKKHDNSYQGPDKVEFTPLSTVLQIGAGQSTTASTTAQLIGEQRDSDLTFDVIVVDSLTTADQDDYSLPANSVTIEANSSAAPFDVLVNGDNLNAGEVVDIAVQLQGTDGVEPAENLKTFTVTLQSTN